MFLWPRRVVWALWVAMMASLQPGCAGEGADLVLVSTTTTIGSGGALLTTIQQNIFTPTCSVSGCHDALTQPEGLTLFSAEAAFNTLVGVPSSCSEKIRVVPGQPAASYLIDKLGDGEAHCGAPMPRNLPSLSTGELQLIRDWITAGAQPANSVASHATSSSTTMVTVTLTTTTTSSTIGNQ